MRFSLSRALSRIALAGLACGSSFSQTAVTPPAAPSRIEPGLEEAVNWKWWVVPPASRDWGMELPEELRPKNPDSEPPKAIIARPETYEVIKGDAIAKIAKKFEMTSAQLKQFNGLKDDLIKVGQVLRIPTTEQLIAMAPPPPPPAKERKAKGAPEPAPEPDYLAQQELNNVRLQVFLDREMFSPGMIDGKAGATFLKISEVYQQTHSDAANPDRLKAKAEAAMKEPYTHYVLRADDFKFIRTPATKPAPAGTKTPVSAKKKVTNPASPAPSQTVTIDDLVAADFLAYRSAWEFVAERFHCDETFLRHINPLLKDPPAVGADFKVPDVIPFEIDKSVDLPLQPAADPQNPVIAAVVLVSRLEIRRGGNLIAVMPLASARPGLRGRGSWTVLDAIPQPRMATKREPRELPKETPAQPGEVVSNTNPPISPPLDKEQHLASGPNNPVGVIWINLAKSGSTDPLPYGLHGTGIPAKMGTLQGIGGLRLTNWDIARAARLIPAGTALQWKAR